MCVSFVDILIQKGYQLHGSAQIISKENDAYKELLDRIHSLSEERFPIKSIIKISIEKATWSKHHWETVYGYAVV